MNARVIRRFKDKETGKVRNVGEIFKCTKARFDAIRAVGKLVEEVELPKAEEESEKEAEEQPSETEQEPEEQPEEAAEEQPKATKRKRTTKKVEADAETAE